MPDSTASCIYKICPQEAWREAERAGIYRGSGDDQRDGFIHFSAPNQIARTLARHFAGQVDLVLVAVAAEALGDDLKWEAAGDGTLYPHLYIPLDPRHALSVQAIPFDGVRHVLLMWG